MGTPTVDGGAYNGAKTPSRAALQRCAVDADCGSLLYGRCVALASYFGTKYCVGGCTTDDDCVPGLVCLCDTPVGRCVTATCKVDRDCGPGSLCATYAGGNQYCSADAEGVACQHPDDECLGKDCPPDKAYCVNDSVSAQRTCVNLGVGGCGRPFLVDGSERVAKVRRRPDWRERGVEPARILDLGVDERARCAAHWTEMAQMEHASIAAFARFSLELLALGAPASLVRDSALAMADEQRHAERCFALASAYGGHAIGPDVLELDHCLTRPTLESVVSTTLLEGCIGELVAAAEARELSTSVSDVLVQRTLSEIADDEARHAALAWRFLAWALEQGGPSLRLHARGIVCAELDRAREHLARPDAPADPSSVALGIPSRSLREELRAEVIARVVIPCLDGLTRDVRGEEARA